MVGYDLGFPDLLPKQFSHADARAWFARTRNERKLYVKQARTYLLTGSASGIGRATKELLLSQGHRVIGVDLRDAEVITDLGTHSGRDLMIDQVTKISGGSVDALLAVAYLKYF